MKKVTGSAVVWQNALLFFAFSAVTLANKYGKRFQIVKEKFTSLRGKLL
ncbi:hypothetical protein [Neobacillus vireti]|nr:hypothetical protein [Neobacillus vireti]